MKKYAISARQSNTSICRWCCCCCRRAVDERDATELDQLVLATLIEPRTNWSSKTGCIVCTRNCVDTPHARIYAYAHWITQLILSNRCVVEQVRLIKRFSRTQMIYHATNIRGVIHGSHSVYLIWKIRKKGGGLYANREETMYTFGRDMLYSEELIHCDIFVNRLVRWESGHFLIYRK